MRVRPLAANEYPRIYCTECRRGAPAVQRSELFVVDLSQRFHFIICRDCLKQMHHTVEECRVQHDPRAKAFADVQHAAAHVADHAADLLDEVFHLHAGLIPDQLPSLTQYQVNATEVYTPIAIAVRGHQDATRHMMALAKEARRDA